MISENESYNKNKSIKEIPLFSELSIEQLKKISAISKIQKFTKNKIIFLEGDNYEGFYIVLKGKIKVYKSSPEGKEIILHIIKTLQQFADVPLFEGGNYPANAQSLEECILLFVPKNEFVQLISDNPEISLKVIAGFAKRLRKMSNQIESITLHEVSNRLANYLLLEIEKAGNLALPEPFVKLNLSKSTIASFLGTITETLSRTFKKMQDENILRVDGKKVFIKNISELKKLAR